MVAVTLEAPTGASSSSRRGALAVRGVSHAFDIGGTRLPVLDDIDLTIAPGSFVALLGPSGCGKSTLLRLAAGLEPPESGTLALDGETIAGPDPERLLVFQDPTALSLAHGAGECLAGPGGRAGCFAAIGTASTRRWTSSGLPTSPRPIPTSSPAAWPSARRSPGLSSTIRACSSSTSLWASSTLSLASPCRAKLVRLWQESRFTALLVTHDVEEALILAQRVIVLSDRPARIRTEIAVDAPYPRRRDDPKLLSLRTEILGILGEK